MKFGISVAFIHHSRMGKDLTIKISNMDKIPIFHILGVIGFMPHAQFFPPPLLPRSIFFKNMNHRLNINLFCYAAQIFTHQKIRKREAMAREETEHTV